MLRGGDEVLKRVIDVSGKMIEPNERRGLLEEYVRSDIPDLAVIRGRKKSLSKNRNAAGLMLYEPRVSELNGRIYVTGVSYTVILKKFEYWLIVGIDPQMTRSHLYERIQERMGSVEKIANVSEVLSDIWTPLVRMRNLRGGIRTPLQFFTPWNDGLFYGRVMSADVTGLNPVARAAFWRGKDLW